MAGPKMYLEVTDATQDQVIGDRWKDGTTVVILTPDGQDATGHWNTDRGSDIDSAGGTNDATYQWRKKEGFLLLETSDHKGLAHALLFLKGFKEYKPNSSGDGIFPFRSRNCEVSWKALFGRRDSAEKEDAINAKGARAKILEAKSRGSRKVAELSLVEAGNYASNIRNEELRTTIEDEIRACREELDDKEKENKKKK
jgi:hypothetical protein